VMVRHADSIAPEAVSFLGDPSEQPDSGRGAKGRSPL
jgi:hypothetical protein